MNDLINNNPSQGIVFFPRNGQPICQDKTAGKPGKKAIYRILRSKFFSSKQFRKNNEAIF